VFQRFSFSVSLSYDHWAKPMRTVWMYLLCDVWQCNKVCGDGQQTRQVWCKMNPGATIPGAVSDILPDVRCDSRSRPADTQQCNADSCTGTEWMSSDWSPVSSVQFNSVVCLLAANRGSNNCSLRWAMDGCILRCGTISSYQSATTSEIVQALLVSCKKRYSKCWALPLPLFLLKFS